MDNNYIPPSFIIGKEFEDFIEKKIFPAQYYELLHKTHDFSQNSDRYVADSLKPDFKFRCKKNGHEFFVEVKYRSEELAQEKISIFKPGQIERYRLIDVTEAPVFIAIGFKGEPGNPRMLSFFSVREKLYQDLYLSVLRRHEIPPRPYHQDTLHTYLQHVKEKEPIHIEKSEEQFHAATSPPKTHKEKKSFTKYFIAAVSVLTIVFAGIFLYKNQNTVPLVPPAQPKTNFISSHPINARKNIPVKAENNFLLSDTSAAVELLTASLVGEWKGRFNDDTFSLLVNSIDNDLGLSVTATVSGQVKELSGTIIPHSESQFKITLLGNSQDGVYFLKFEKGNIKLNGDWALSATNRTDKINITLYKE